MAEPLLIRSEVHSYHVTGRCLNKEFFPLSLEEVWKIMLEELEYAGQTHRLCVHAFVLMGNHFHLLCHTPQKNLDVIMRSFMERTSFRIKSGALRENLWEGTYQWSLVRSQRHYFQVYRYIHQNPRRAGLVSKVEDYPYSTLQDTPLLIYSFIPLSFGGREGEFIWLNEMYGEEEIEFIRKWNNRLHNFI